MKCSTPRCDRHVADAIEDQEEVTLCTSCFCAAERATRETDKRLQHAIFIVDAAEKWEQTVPDSPDGVKVKLDLANAIYHHASAARGEAKPSCVPTSPTTSPGRRSRP